MINYAILGADLQATDLISSIQLWRRPLSALKLFLLLSVKSHNLRGLAWLKFTISQTAPMYARSETYNTLMSGYEYAHAWLLYAI